ncbi:J domain-containing protein [Rhodospirillum rubrum]|uniref:Heat shock protein DnaJ-like n=1 Tax=Rhodospirillum rubrum (strain ATCC 11170 / ATH 1.1.1 / DSM 467 / LMG 4362 / NCIMB 8255 / S1) TaxID=269796 RepID=Q2RNE2_RHORT|nr:J domain-containing protein [Rhodospirillum rubrum]ABC24353.1 Heat shock protein DnaJ-like [Rhodospirillum rubrum ATCC 11170]AEO50104.1 heat shock protein DnaJ-like protein [Rhodospirillum rubrum F11]MBK5956073.1 J domain-containing protein [Rhodospirillum rubrum]QXG80279.1 J domain-containing protein [Rhodospirillum rubrum]
MVAELKQSYTIPCASVFRDAVLALALRRRVNVGDLARSVMLVVAPDDIAGFADPGDAPPGDREEVILKSGPSAGRPWRRKPRLQVRMAPGVDWRILRKALAMALAMDEGRLKVRVDDKTELAARVAEAVAVERDRLGVMLAAARARDERPLTQAREEIARLRAAIDVLVTEPLPGGVGSRLDALFVLGFPPGTTPDPAEVTARFRLLATIHHPDSDLGSHARMSQLNQAVAYLRGR